MNKKTILTFLSAGIILFTACTKELPVTDSTPTIPSVSEEAETTESITTEEQTQEQIPPEDPAEIPIRDFHVDREISYDGANVTFYDAEADEYYDEDEDGFLAFPTYADYILRNSEYRNNHKLRDFLNSLPSTQIPIHNKTVVLDRENGILSFFPWWDFMFNPDDFFNINYLDNYYFEMEYHFDEDKFLLKGPGENVKDSLELLDGFSEYSENLDINRTTEITWDDLDKLYFRELGIAGLADGFLPEEADYKAEGVKFELVFYKPFSDTIFP